ncbi:DUF445 domain-containing protein [Corynebacterium sp. CCM 9203]|uniref:DUF445 domain-containing protein n=1 Tax=Corynebacterium sp. CCM 9203 TaxID=3057615 RepID=UPI003523684C
MGTHEFTTHRDAEPLAVPGPSPEVEAERRRQLRRYKAFATGLLIIAAAIFLFCRWLETRPGGVDPWVGFVRAASEAGMIGGLADWFAVTALFRRPLGLPIPHTAIVRNKKDQIGESLGGFVGENFLNAELITAKVRAAGIPNRLGRWLSEPDNAETVSREIGRLTGKIITALDPADAEAVINSTLIEKLAEPEWGPPAGKLIGQLIEEGKTEPIVDELVYWLHIKAEDAGPFITRMLDERRPSWAPQILNDVIGDKVHRELVEWTAAVAADPEHEARQAVRRFIRQLSTDLQNDPEMIGRVEKIKRDIMGSTPVQGAAATIWRSASRSLLSASADRDSLLRSKTRELAITWGNNLLDDAALRESLDRRVTGAAAFLADNYAEEITSIISETVERWDADEAGEKIELMVGKDLQYIRLNGTIVGALAGLGIYAVSHLLFGA